VFRGNHARLAGVVLDAGMPRTPCADVCRAMESTDPAVPVLLVTGYSLDEETRKRVAPTARGFLAKPFDAALLSETLHALARRA
jgi:DNA-binding response OmpR family regulator